MTRSIPPEIQPPPGTAPNNESIGWSHPVAKRGWGPYGFRTPGIIGVATEPAASGTKYYVADSGSDGNNGTSKDLPLASFDPVSNNGSLEAGSGDVIVVLEEGVTLDTADQCAVIRNSGVTICGEDGTYPTVQSNVVDGSTEAIFSSTDLVVRGLHLNGPSNPDSYNGIGYDNAYTGQTVPMSYSDAKNGGWVYNVKVTHFGLSGIFFGEGGGGVVERCESAYHYGPDDADGTGGGNSDGVQWTSGPNDADPHLGGWLLDTLLHHNTDDGLDLFRARGHVTDRCMAFSNGLREDGTRDGVEAAAKGFKLGGDDDSKDIGGNIVRRSATAFNHSAGVGSNGANLPNDYINIVAWGNSKEGTNNDRSYERDYEFFESSGNHPSGYNLADSRIVNCIGEEGLYVSLQSGSFDSTNVIACNFDSDNNFDPSFANIVFASTFLDSAGYTNSLNSFGRLGTNEDATSLPGIIDAGSDTYQTTPASQYHGITTVPSFNGAAPDLGAFETG